MSMLLNMDLKDFFKKKKRLLFFRRGAAQLLPVEIGEVGGHLLDELANGASWSFSCNPPAVPYLGMYLTDLAFIEEGTPNFTEEGLVNFSKMRMVGSRFM